MYLEERVEQLENLAVDQGKQIQTVAKAVATLTVEVKQGFADLRQEVSRLADNQDRIQQDVTRLADSQDGLHERFNQLDRRIDQDVDELRTEINQRFDQLVTLIQDRLK